MPKAKKRDRSVSAARASRAKLTALESLKRLEEFPERKEHFVAAVRKGKDRIISATHPRYTKEEFARRGDEVYERDIREHLRASQEDQFVAIDIETGAYEVDADELTASDRLMTRVPNAQIWLRRVGSRYSRRFGHWEQSVVS
jgi:hypothetical protein